LYRAKGMDLVAVFCRQISSFPASFVEEAVFIPWNGLGTFVKNQEGIAASSLFLMVFVFSVMVLSPSRLRMDTFLSVLQFSL
jgi:hypothetical protein